MKNHALNAAAIFAVGFTVAMIYMAATTDNPAERQRFVDMLSSGDPSYAPNNMATAPAGAN